jgi:nucleotide-binding universal stress UspA family protein
VTVPFTHVLVPTDFSDPANEALRYAIEEATLHRAGITLLHVLAPHRETDVYYVTGSPPTSGYTAGLDPDAGGHLGGFPLSPPTTVRLDPDQDALARLRDLVGETFAGAWQVAVAVGHPAEAIVHVARERNADLIVMGTHGRTGLQHVLLGSVAEKVVRLAPCPVMTVRFKGNTGTP